MLQFPAEVSGPITIWPRFTDPLTNNQINIRCVLQGSFWNDDSIAVWQRTGQQTSNSVSLYIPYAKEVTGRAYISPDEWSNLAVGELDQYWTADPLNLPLMVKGVSDFEFEWTDRIALAENNFQKSNVHVRRAKDINEQLFGTVDMWHIELRC